MTVSGSRLLRPVSLLFLFLLFGVVAWLWVSAPINMVTADLGRHLQNGRQFIEHGRILDTNFYSYTADDFPAPCHHWGFGVLAVLLWKVWGFSGLSWSYAGLLAFTLVVAMVHACRNAGPGATLLAGALVLPLIGSRVEIRPEGISTFFLAAEFFMLSEWRQGRLRSRWLLCLLPLFVLWVNLHILFIAGLVLLLIYVVDAWFCTRQIPRARGLLFVFGGAVAATLINPFILRGLLEPASIFQGYGYQLVENKSVFFLMKRFPGQVLHGYYLLLMAMAVGALVWRMLRERDWRPAAPHAGALLVFGVLGMMAVRGIAMAGFVLVPVMAEAVSGVMGVSPWRRRLVWGGAAGAVLLAALVPGSVFSPLGRFSGRVPAPYQGSIGAVLARPGVWSGTLPGVAGAAEFFRSSGMKGPVFNNYDIGGYFIYYLYPGERPFVDNRPEAYPESFFRDVYIPMQEQDPVWRAMLERYRFEAVMFYRHDMTPWAQPFLLRRLDDPEWAPVFVDDYVLILARRGGVNRQVIRTHELPRAIFHTRGS